MPLHHIGPWCFAFHISNFKTRAFYTWIHNFAKHIWPISINQLGFQIMFLKTLKFFVINLYLKMITFEPMTKGSNNIYQSLHFLFDIIIFQRFNCIYFLKMDNNWCQIDYFKIIPLNCNHLLSNLKVIIFFILFQWFFFNTYYERPEQVSQKMKSKSYSYPSFKMVIKF
jgi:hypothetical protein